MRTGIGYDIHRIMPTRERSSVPVGGVPIPCYFKAEAHSDGDVLLHAILDACLGAMALGDIGQWFPDSDPKNYKVASREFIKVGLAEIKRLGWRVHQIDSTLILE